MAHCLFIDESGQDRRASPYEVLAGVSIEDADLWNLVLAVQDAENQAFGRRFGTPDRELKAARLLTTKVFRHARQLEPLESAARTQLAYSALTNPTAAGRAELTGLAQAKLSFVAEVLSLCNRFRCQAFASIIADPRPRPPRRDHHLRKDYSYLFERFCYYLEDRRYESQGLVVFDELERSACHLLVAQMDSYFKRTAKGRERSRLIVPEPFFVHSDLTTGILLADLVAYLISWGFRLPSLDKPLRPELKPFVDQVCALRYRARRNEPHENFDIWSFAVIGNLLPGPGEE